MKWIDFTAGAWVWGLTPIMNRSILEGWLTESIGGYDSISRISMSSQITIHGSDDVKTQLENHITPGFGRLTRIPGLEQNRRSDEPRDITEIVQKAFWE